MVKKTRTRVDDKIIHRTGKPISLILILIGVRLAIMPLNLEEKLMSGSTDLILSLIILAISYTFVMVFDVLINNWGLKWARKTKSTLDDNLVSLLQKTSKFIIFSIAFIYVLEIWGIEIIPFLASMGIAGIAIAFALQDSLGDVFGGLTLILDKSVKVGDVIELDDETTGTVIDIGLRSTKLNTFDNELVIVPNGKLSDSKIINYAEPDQTARLVLPFGVAYGSDIEKVKKIILEKVNNLDHVLDDPKPIVRFVEMGESSLNFKLYLQVEHYSNRFEIKDKVNTIIYKTLREQGVEIPNPQLDVWLRK
ncbi:MAG: mechanosensitive ion channel [Candidatus Aenigmarchaeota archaeon]|nr:mechanosensitive ion channel [Candidatus Aenigmarchaeota archaeon]